MDYLSTHLKMKMTEHLSQSIIYQKLELSFFWCANKKEGETYEKTTDISRNKDYTTGNLLDYEYFSKHYRLIAIDLCKHIE